MDKAIYFDMDGTIANFYGVDGWLESILAKDVRPYAEALPLVNMSSLARVIHRLQRLGFTVGIISWLAKVDDDVYGEAVTRTKKAWLAKHLPSVAFDEIIIVKYGTPKQTLGQGILFDDEKPNRDNWIGKAYNVDNIIEILKEIAKNA